MSAIYPVEQARVEQARVEQARVEQARVEQARVQRARVGPMLTTASAPPLAGSYDPATTTAGGFTGEIARLEAQAALSFPEELRILCELGIAGPVLELGAGSGAVTRRLVDAGLSVIALDIDPSLLAHAAESGAQLLVGDASAIPLPDASVSSVLIRYVLQHVRSPSAVLAEARRVVRPGGLVALVDVDSAMWGCADPLYPELGGIHANSRQRRSRRR